MAKITITKGNEFMIAVRDEITKDDLFIEQYECAANILDRIPYYSMATSFSGSTAISSGTAVHRNRRKLPGFPGSAAVTQAYTVRPFHRFVMTLRHPRGTERQVIPSADLSGTWSMRLTKQCPLR